MQKYTQKNTMSENNNNTNTQGQDSWQLKSKLLDFKKTSKPKFGFVKKPNTTAALYSPSSAKNKSNKILKLDKPTPTYLQHDVNDSNRVIGSANEFNARFEGKFYFSGIHKTLEQT